MNPMQHMTVVEDYDPLTELPDDLVGKTVVVRCTAQIGDCLMTIGSLVPKLLEMGAGVAAAVKSYQIPLISKLKGVNGCFQTTDLNNPKFRRNFDVILNLSKALVTSREIVDQEYYSRIWDVAGVTGEPTIGSFKPLPKYDFPTGSGCVALHASSTNPIRRWSNEYWKTLAYRIRDAGYNVLFLGLKEDYGFTDTHIYKASSFSEDLVDQTCMLQSCVKFVGNDSGFAHIAGLLDLEGVVLFSATRPEHVIARYPMLKSIDVYEQLGVTPSRSTKTHDPNAFECMQRICPSDVFNTLVIPEKTKMFGRKYHLNDKQFPKRMCAAGNTWPKEVQHGTIRFIPQYHGAGDVIMSTAVLKRAREMFPQAKLVFQCKPVFACLLPEYVTHESLGESAEPADEEIVVSYYDCWRDGESALDRMGGVAEDMSLPALPSIEVPAKSVGFWVRQGSNPNKIKEWGDPYWDLLAEGLTKQGITCFQLGGLNDVLVPSEHIKDLRKESLLDSLGTLAAVDVVVTIDGVAQHACRAMNKQAIVLWGGSCTPEVIGYPEHINLLSKSDKKCWGSVCQSTYQQGDCCGDGSCVDAATGEVHWFVTSMMDGSLGS